MKYRKRAHGFTLIELVVTLAILALIAVIAVPLAQTETKRIRENELRRSLREIRTALDTYKKAVDEGKILKELDSVGYPKTLNVLVDGVEDARSPTKSKIFFLRRVPRDPMNPDVSLTAANTWGKRSYA